MHARDKREILRAYVTAGMGQGIAPAPSREGPDPG